jgi:hypothetical protein
MSRATVWTPRSLLPLIGEGDMAESTCITIKLNPAVEIATKRSKKLKTQDNNEQPDR